MWLEGALRVITPAPKGNLCCKGFVTEYSKEYVKIKKTTYVLAEVSTLKY